ncbi:MAG TPA: metallophosphoesterase [Azonexus sp.]|nr:metallophosphoesterase [Azonexus sp.]
MQKLVFPVLLGASVLAAAMTAQADDSHRRDGVLNIAVIGDMPYGLNNADTVQFKATPAFINAINADTDVSLVLHLGDIHSGKQTCSYGYNQSIYDLWTSAPGFKSPVIYTPGDNEWTDCHKPKEGGLDPLTNLAYVREIFFPVAGNAIAVDKPLLSQAQSFDANFPSDAEFVENVMWEQSGVVFVTLNVPGGSNNDEDNWYGAARTPEQTAEVLKRTSADLRWLDKAFALAKSHHARAVLIQLQADMWDLDGTHPQDLHIANYRQFIDSIALNATNFGKPVLLMNGDSHGYRSDNPLVKGAPCLTESGASEVACSDDAYESQANGYNVPNFHRIVVHGSVAPMEWIKLSVKPGDSDGRSKANSFGPFSWQRKITALGYPAP